MQPAMRLSVVMITRNAAALLPDCLASVQWADEIVVLDHGSHDATRQIAEQQGARVYTASEWPGFGIQRQRAQGYASGDMVLMLDADERVTPALRASIEAVLRQDANTVRHTVYSIGRRNWFLGRYMRHSGWYPDRVIRLYARTGYAYSNLQVHESLDVQQARVEKLTGDLLHLTCLDLIGFQQKQLQYAQAWATERHHNGRRCNFLSVISHTLGAFLKTWLIRAGFLDGKQGWLLAMVNAQYTFNKYAALWALSHADKDNA